VRGFDPLASSVREDSEVVRVEAASPGRVPRDLIGVQEAGNDDRWPFAERFVRRLVAERRVPTYKISRRVYVSASDLDKLVADGFRPAESA
jgi:hypothetical protein